MKRITPIEQLEEVVFEHSEAYGRSSAFALALDFVKEHDMNRYEQLLRTEIDEMGIKL